MRAYNHEENPKQLRQTQKFLQNLKNKKSQKLLQKPERQFLCSPKGKTNNLPQTSSNSTKSIQLGVEESKTRLKFKMKNEKKEEMIRRREQFVDIRELQKFYEVLKKFVIEVGKILELFSLQIRKQLPPVVNHMLSKAESHLQILSDPPQIISKQLSHCSEAKKLLISESTSQNLVSEKVLQTNHSIGVFEKSQNKKSEKEQKINHSQTGQLQKTLLRHAKSNQIYFRQNKQIQ